jgi:hypothetical protein
MNWLLMLNILTLELTLAAGECKERAICWLWLSGGKFFSYCEMRTKWDILKIISLWDTKNIIINPNRTEGAFDHNYIYSALGYC